MQAAITVGTTQMPGTERSGHRLASQAKPAIAVSISASSNSERFTSPRDFSSVLARLTNTSATVSANTIAQPGRHRHSGSKAQQNAAAAR